MAATCEQCRKAGPSCAVTVDMTADKAACVMCWLPTAVRSGCKVPRHNDCQRFAPAGRPAPATPPAAPAAAPAVWLGAQAKQKTTRGQSAGRLQPRLLDHLTEAAPELTAAERARAVELWNTTMRSIEFTGMFHTTRKILEGTFGHGSIPELPRFDLEWLAPLASAPLWSARSWLIEPPGGKPGWSDRQVFTGWDVNGMYVSAADRSLGTGAPEHLQWPGDGVLKLPGYVRLSTLERAPWGLLGRWEEGMWCPTPIAEYLKDVGCEFLIVEALVWPTHRKWLGPHVALIREARMFLMQLGPEDLAAMVVLDILKELYTLMFGGLLRSEEHNPGASLNRAWADMLPATGQARMFRLLDKTPGRLAGSPVWVAGLHVDAVWFVMPEGYRYPPGLIYSDHAGPCVGRECHQLGKFKPAGRTWWTPELHAAYVDGQFKPLWAALDTARKAAKGGR